MEQCAATQELISRLLDGDLDAAEQAALAEHLAVCPECKALYEAFSAVSGALEEQQEEPPERLHENVMAAVRRDAMGKRNRRARRRWGALLSAAAVAALAIGLRFGLNRAPAALNMTAVDFAAEEAAEEPPVEEELLMEAPKAARSSADFAAAAQAVPEANAAPTEGAAEQMMMDYAALPASPVCDLSDTLRFAELLETLGGEKVTLPLERLDEEPALIVRCADGELSLFEYEGALYYYDPVGETLMRTPLSREDVYDLGTKPAP